MKRRLVAVSQKAVQTLGLLKAKVRRSAQNLGHKRMVAADSLCNFPFKSAADFRSHISKCSSTDGPSFSFVSQSLELAARIGAIFVRFNTDYDIRDRNNQYLRSNASVSVPIHAAGDRMSVRIELSNRWLRVGNLEPPDELDLGEDEARVRVRSNETMIRSILEVSF